MFDEEGGDPGGRQLGESLPGALTAGRRAGLGGLRKLDEALGRVAMGEFTDRDHGDLILGILGILIRKFDAVGRLARQQHLQRLGPGRTTELRIGDQGGERVGRERRHLELKKRHEFEGGLQCVGAALE